MKKNKLIDKLLLVLTGFSILLFYFIADITLGKIVSKEWADFTLSSTIYLIIILWGALTFKEFKKIPKFKLLLFWGGFYILTVSSAFLAFRYELLPMPKSFHVYTLFIVILLILGSIFLLEYLVKKVKFFRNNKGKQTGGNPKK